MDGRGTETALLIASKEHWRIPTDISPQGWIDFGAMNTWAFENYDLPGGMLFVRFGDMRLNAGTVPHMHWNLWVPNETKEVRVPIYKTPEDTLNNIERQQRFATLYQLAFTPDHFEKLIKIGLATVDGQLVPDGV